MQKDSFVKLILSIFISAFVLTVQAEDCLIDGNKVELTGKIWRETFPGPPNYKSIEDGDKPQTYWILTTEEPHCGKAYSMESGNVYKLNGSFNRFQLVLSGKEYEKNQSLVFNRATVKGQLFSAYTGHHKTKMLIKVEELQSSSE